MAALCARSALLPHSSQQLPAARSPIIGRRPLISGARPSPTSPVRSLSEDGAETAADLLAETEALLANLSKGEPVPAPAQGYLSDDDNRQAEYRFEVSCDVNGCIIRPVAQDRGVPGPAGVASPVQDKQPAEPADFLYHEGSGWKLGVFPGAESNGTYSAVIGNDSCSFALTKEELTDFIQLLKNLRRSVTTLDICGQWGETGEDATLEMQTPRVWLQGRAPQKRLSTLQDYWRHGESSAASIEGHDLSSAFALRFIVRSPGSREVEGSWYAEAVMSVFEFLDGAEGGSFIDQIQADEGLSSPRRL